MDTGLKYEGEAARKRFVVYWLRPALAALGFGLFTFLVIAVPSEKEKIELRGEVHRLRAENEDAQKRLREMLPFANLGRAGAGGEDRAADRRRVLAPRVVVGDDDTVGARRRDLRHLRALGTVAVTAAAEHHDELSANRRAQRIEHGR